MVVTIKRDSGLFDKSVADELNKSFATINEKIEKFVEENRETPENNSTEKLIKVLRNPAFRKEIAHFSGNDYRDLGKTIAEV